jgi:hypothetical protein
MADADPTIIAVQKCGCVTMATVVRGDLDRTQREWINDAVMDGASIIHTTSGKARRRKNFLPVECPHDPKGWEPFDV